jgi:phage gpG-like protein
MADRLSIEVESGQILAALSRAVNLIDNPQALLLAIGLELEGNIRGRFTTKTDPSGRPWQPLAETTRKAYEKKYKGNVPGSLLNRSGGMLNTLASNVQGNAVEVGFSRSYAIFHVTGTRKMPRRDSLFASIAASAESGTLGAQDEADVREIIEQHLRDALGDAAA